MTTTSSPWAREASPSVTVPTTTRATSPGAASPRRGAGPALDSGGRGGLGVGRGPCWRW